MSIIFHVYVKADFYFSNVTQVYYQLENLSQGDPPYKSVAALNCIILGCSNTWDVDRAYQTFEAISATFGLIPNTHSYNALMCAFAKLKKVPTNVFPPGPFCTRNKKINLV